MGMVRVKTTNVGAVTLSTGVDNVTVVSNSGAASINNDTLYLDFPVAAAENFTLNNQTVKGASISGADVTFDNGIANISITGAETFTLNGAEVSAVSITGAEVNFDNNTALVSIGGEDNVIENIIIDGLNASIDNKTATFNLGLDSLKNDFANAVTSFSILGGAAASINNHSAVIDLSDYENTIENISVVGGSCSIDNKSAVISISGGDENIIENIIIDGINASIDNKVASFDFGIDSLKSDFGTLAASVSSLQTAVQNVSGGSGDGLQNISIDGNLADVDTQTKVANINLPYASEENLDDTTTTIATAGFVNAIIRRLVGNAPSALDTLGELAAALNNDDDFAATVTNLISQKQDQLNMTNFAANLLKCNSAADLRNYWAGFKDLDFDEAGKTWTAYGSPYMANNNPKFTGSKCLVCNGSSYIQRSMTLGNTDFTVEYFWRHLASSAGDAAVSFFMDSDNRFRLLFSASNGDLQGFAKCNATAVTTDVVTASVTSSWWYCAIQYDKTNSTLTFSVRDSNDTEIFNQTYQVSFVTGTYQVVIGGTRTSTSNVTGLTGYVDEVRFSNVLRDVSSVPTEPFTLDENTISLLHFNG